MAIWNQFPQLSCLFLESHNLSSFLLTYKASCPLYKVPLPLTVTLSLPLSPWLNYSAHFYCILWLCLSISSFVFCQTLVRVIYSYCSFSFPPTHILTGIYCMESGFCSYHLIKNIFTNNVLIISHKSYGLYSDLMVPELSAAHNCLPPHLFFNTFFPSVSRNTVLSWILVHSSLSPPFLFLTDL